MTHQPDEAREEALRLAKEADLNEVDVWAHDPHPDNDKWILSDNDLVRLIALARASQAQPPAGWEQDAKRLLIEARDTLDDPRLSNWRYIESGDFYSDFRAVVERIDAAIAAAPSPITGEKG